VKETEEEVGGRGFMGGRRKGKNERVTFVEE